MYEFTHFPALLLQSNGSFFLSKQIPNDRIKEDIHRLFEGCHLSIPISDSDIQATMQPY